jgi:hypothetical protein
MFFLHIVGFHRFKTVIYKKVKTVPKRNGFLIRSDFQSYIVLSGHLKSSLQVAQTTVPLQ